MVPNTYREGTYSEVYPNISQDAEGMQKLFKQFSFGTVKRPRWPVIILRTPKGWTGPKEVDGQKTKGSWRSHQVPFAEMASKPEHVKLLEEWMRSYKPDELFDERGKLRSELAELAPAGTRRVGANPHANSGILLKELKRPDFRD